MFAGVIWEERWLLGHREAVSRNCLQ
jgi:hypothetical protein